MGCFGDGNAHKNSAPPYGTLREKRALAAVKKTIDAA